MNIKENIEIMGCDKYWFCIIVSLFFIYSVQLRSLSFGPLHELGAFVQKPAGGADADERRHGEGAAGGGLRKAPELPAAPRQRAGAPETGGARQKAHDETAAGGV